MHFHRALTPTLALALNDQQAYVANIFLVNCGVLMAREAMREIAFLNGTSMRTTTWESWSGTRSKCRWRASGCSTVMCS